MITIISTRKAAKLNVKQAIVITLLIALIFCLYPNTANADMGPKPHLTIIVHHPPAGEYYLDLLVKGDGDYDNLDTDRASYDQTKLSLLEDYNEDGWHAGLARGTGVPMWGELTGVKDSDMMVHNFNYVGVPEDFELIIITPG